MPVITTAPAAYTVHYPDANEPPVQSMDPRGASIQSQQQQPVRLSDDSPLTALVHAAEHHSLPEESIDEMAKAFDLSVHVVNGPDGTDRTYNPTGMLKINVPYISNDLDFEPPQK